MQTLERLSLEEGSKDRKVAVPQMKDRDAWERFCFASEIDPLSMQSSVSDIIMEEQTETAGVQASSVAMEEGAGASEGSHTPGDAAECTPASSAADRAVSKRKRDLAYQLGITLVKKTDDSAFEVTQQTHTSRPAEAGSDDDEGEDLDDVENEEVDAAIEGAWAQATKAMQWSGAVNVEPTTTVLLQFDQVLTQRLLALHIDWMEDR